MESISIPIKAKNSSGEQELTFGYDRESGFHMILDGKYKNNHFQIDFDEILDADLNDLIEMLTLIRDTKE